MRVDKALDGLRSLERRKRRRIDDASVPFFAHLRNAGLLNNEDWSVIKADMADAIDLLRKSKQKEEGPSTLTGTLAMPIGAGLCAHSGRSSISGQDRQSFGCGA